MTPSEGLSRRGFLQATVAGGALACGLARGSEQATGVATAAKPPTSRITSPYPGTTYEAVVPDTLDLAERAELALHGIAGTSDANDDFLMWFEVFWCNRPPYLKHSGCDVECAPKFLDCMTLLRNACGSNKYLEIEQGLLKAVMSFVSPEDGLYYAKYNPKRPWHLDAYADKGYKTQPQDYAIPGTTGILLTALAVRNAAGITPCADLVEKIARGLARETIKKQDPATGKTYAYYPEGGKTGHPFTRPRSGWLNTDEPRSEHEGGEGSVVAYFGYPLRGLAMWASQSGDEQVLESAAQIARFISKPKFWGHPADPPRVAGSEQGHVDSHFHARAIALRGLLEYGLVAGDSRACDLVRSSYEQMRTYGIHEIGFMPTWPADRPSMEGCMLGDLIAMTVKMSDAGLGDYWEDADRIIRNHLAEGQYTRRDLLEQIAAQQPQTQPTGHPRQVCTDSVLDRMLGIYASYLMPDHSLVARTMQCCTAYATRGLYYAWEAITRCQGDQAQVNLLLNRAAPWLDIDSHLPHEGRVVIRNKTARRIAVRIPPWFNQRQFRCTVNAQERRLAMTGRYQAFDELKPGDVIELRFAVPETTLSRTAHAKTKNEAVYTITMRGKTATKIAPRHGAPGVYPMYDRDYMLKPAAPMKTVRRWVPDAVARW